MRVLITKIRNYHDMYNCHKAVKVWKLFGIVIWSKKL